MFALKKFLVSKSIERVTNTAWEVGSNDCYTVIKSFFFFFFFKNVLTCASNIKRRTRRNEDAQRYSISKGTYF